MALTLRLRTDTGVPVDVAGILPETMRALTGEEISGRVVRVGRNEVALGEVFSITGDAADETLVMEGDVGRLVHLGARMTGGVMRVSGSAGRGVGREMRGGRIEVFGDVGDDAGAMMRGGLLWIHGNAGDRVGGGDLGFRHGMRGGMIVVDGSTGVDAGRAMRRGTIVIRGSCGGGVMANAIAGTVLVCGSCRGPIAPGMVRGTLILLGGEEISLLPYYAAGRRCRPLFLSLLYSHLGRVGLDLESMDGGREFRQYHGDRLELGLGEVFVGIP